MWVSFFHLRLDVQQQLGHLLRPVLFVLIHDELEFPKMVGIAKSMLAVFESEVG